MLPINNNLRIEHINSIATNDKSAISDKLIDLFRIFNILNNDYYHWRRPIHTNFVRGNGFVFVHGKPIHKPIGAIATDGEQYLPLDGSYSCMILSPHPPTARNLAIKKNVLQEENKIGISGPQIISNRKNIVEQIPIRTKDKGQTIKNEINYSPYHDRTSFIAFGITDGGILIVVSMFSGISIQQENLFTFRAENKRQHHE